MSILKNLTPDGIKQYTKNELNVLCDELRSTIYDTVMRCGGHLASNLGSVESIVAMFYTFDFPSSYSPNIFSSLVSGVMAAMDCLYLSTLSKTTST